MTNRLLLLTKLLTLFRKICNNYSVSKNNSLECLNPHSAFVRYVAHDQICNPNRNHDLKY